MADIVSRIYIKQIGRQEVSLRNLPTAVESLWKKTKIQLNQLGYKVVDKHMTSKIVLLEGNHKVNRIISRDASLAQPSLKSVKRI